MKKFTAIVVSLLMAGALFAQKIPEGRNLVAAVYDFAQPENWGGVDSVTYDIQNDTYVIKAYLVCTFETISSDSRAFFERNKKTPIKILLII